MRPHRLVAQDGALSRPKQRFESAWGHQTRIRQERRILYFMPSHPIEGHEAQTAVPKGDAIRVRLEALLNTGVRKAVTVEWI